MLNTSPLEKFFMFLAFVAVVIGIMAGLGIFLEKHSDTDPYQDSPAGQWNDVQKYNFNKQVIDYLTTQIDPPLDHGIALCVAHMVEKKYSFRQVLGTGAENPMDGDIMSMVSQCAGKKGDWNPEFKSGIIKNIEKRNPTFKDACVKCAVDAVEKEISPNDFIGLTGDKQVDMINKKLPSCKSCNDK